MTAGNVNGILNVMKPPGMTSFDVVASLRRILKTKKIGHTGTLDPGAVGVLPVCVGSATKAIEFMTEKDKLYRAELKLGITTDTQDITGQVTDTRKVNVTREQVLDAIMSFVGTYSQVPPMYSAVKINGQKLYELARSGKTIEREPRVVNIYYINVIDISEEDGSVLFDVACSKGTYIRTLCADIGEKLGCGGCMSFLIRLKSGPFDLESSLTLDEIEELYSADRLKEKMFHVDRVFADLDEVVLKEAEIRKIINGAAVRMFKGMKPGVQLRIYDQDHRFVALGITEKYEDSILLRSRKLFLA
ncbi:tRNA pseudouridine(55) synthase TruB [Clostridium thermosuccinogenes]|jgi:tRNA pseudouridine55 synthase|uniref:tRNA pseudouridine(55) synthase TruB n=1 Tax=Clostridium thermosuccinogenes TaxID=84032 RepID=UPI00267989C7